VPGKEGGAHWGLFLLAHTTTIGWSATLAGQQHWLDRNADNFRNIKALFLEFRSETCGMI